MPEAGDGNLHPLILYDSAIDGEIERAEEFGADIFILKLCVEVGGVLMGEHDVDVVVVKGAGCCGALTHLMGMSKEAHAAAARNINAWHSDINNHAAHGGLDYIVINTSGCGTTVKDYGFMFRSDP